jgi:hypothetical protein
MTRETVELDTPANFATLPMDMKAFLQKYLPNRSFPRHDGSVNGIPTDFRAGLFIHQLP